MIFSIAFIMVGIVFEGAMTFLFFKNNITTLNISFLLILLLHVAAVYIFSLGVYLAAKKKHIGNPKNWFISSFACAFTFFGVGFIAVLGFVVLLARQMWEKSDVFDEYERYITYEYAREESHIEPDKLVEKVDEELEISPLVDIMGEKDTGLRRGAINAMQRLPPKDAVRLLRLSLKDNSVEIRFHAAIGLSQIESSINNTIVLARKEVQRNPSSAASHLLLANSYEEYYESGILDEVTAQYYMDLALGEYYKALELGSETVNVLNAIGDLQVRKTNYDKALASFGRACEIEPSNVFSNVGLIQVLYETKKVKEAIERAKQIIGKMPETKGPMREIIQYWAS
jgi:tetratricopeptide (TPR) repeat protein